jgi:hypothetical protein
MKEIFIYLRNYFNEVNKKVAILTTLVVSVLIIFNYTTGIEPAIKAFDSRATRLLSFFLLYAFIFSISYGILFVFSDKVINSKKQFIFLLLVSPLLFAGKVSLDFSYLFNYAGLSEPWARYWKLIVNWPVKCLFILTVIYSIWLKSGYGKPVAGMSRNFNWKPYILLLLCAIPLLMIAGIMSDFQQTYPKVKNIFFIFPYTRHDFVAKVVYELSYGTDFLTIESFFRGFLVLAFVRYVGKDAILPMAAFYCTIHFGKPLFECITSYLGGIMLGAIVYNTRSIWGGFIVHLGMAWLMDLLFYINSAN